MDTRARKFPSRRAGRCATSPPPTGCPSRRPRFVL